MAHYWRIVRRYRHHFAVSPQCAPTSFILPPFLGRVTATGSLRNAKVAEAPGSMLASITELHRRLLCPGAALAIRIALGHTNYPVTRYMVI